MLYQTINEYEMQEQLKACDRNNFSIEALRAYIEFTEELGQPTEFNPIDFDCTYVEFDLTKEKDLHSFIDDYDYLVDDQEFGGFDEKLEALKDAINGKTLVISNDDGCFMFDYNQRY